jgi:hypothetical protein
LVPRDRRAGDAVHPSNNTKPLSGGDAPRHLLRGQPEDAGLIVRDETVLPGRELIDGHSHECADGL